VAKKIKKSLSWLVILALVCLSTAGVNFFSSEVKAGTAQQSIPSGSVNNIAPTVSAVNITDATVTLTENGTTSVTITATITDTNGGDDISSATGLFYLVSEGTSCNDDDNDCYTNISCTLGATDGNNKNATCTASDIYFHAIPGSWGAYVLAADNDAATGSATDTTPSTVATLNALIVTGTISYDALNPGANMASTTKAVNATTTGNAAIDVAIKGDAMTFGSTGTIAVTNQRYSTTTNDAWASANTASSSYVSLEVDMAKPTTHPSDAGDIIYWAWAVPSGTPDGTYSGTNYFNAVSD